MKYTTEVTINLPRERVVKLFGDPGNLPRWQKGLELVEPLEGEPGTPGATTRLVFNQDGRKLDMIETILVRDLPDSLTVLYTMKGVKNRTENRFYDEDGKTRWVMSNEFKFSGPMGIAAFFMRAAFPEQTLKDMKRFRVFAEHVT